MKAQNQELLSKIQIKNQSLMKLEKINKEFEAESLGFQKRINSLQKELELAKAETSRLRIRVESRGAPYY